MRLSFVSEVIHDLTGLVFPHLCVSCERRLIRGEEALCLHCLQDLPFTRDEEHPEDNPVARIFWGRIRIRAAAAYLLFSKEGRVQDILHNLKYNGRQDVGIVCGRLFGEILHRTPVFSSVEVIVPVPLHRKRLAERGYNQAACFARGLSQSMKVPLAENALERIRATQTQTKKSRISRMDNVEGLFSVKQPERLQGKHILLVDDVITTGATLEACAAPLLRLENTTVSIAGIASARG